MLRMDHDADRALCSVGIFYHIMDSGGTAMRKTKIVCTIGPSCESAAVLEEMYRAGMNVARLNFSHGSHEEHQRQLDAVKAVREKLDAPLAVMLDTKGPEYRTGVLENGPVTLKDGDTFTFTAADIMGDQTRVSVSYKRLAEELRPGDKVLVNNGLLSFTVTDIQGTDIICHVDNGGVLSNRKSMSFPGKVLKQVYLSEQDKADLLWGIRNDVDYIACSFVSCKQDLLDVKEFLRQNNAGPISLIAKIENSTGIDNIEEIFSECDGIMIGRGDMGVEIPFEQLPAIQKKIITKCRLLGKRVITATEMLESMIYNPRPTRAEVSDVANAVYDGTSAIMLSGETSMGKYPVLTVKTMARIAETTEESIHYGKRFLKTEFAIRNEMDAVSHAVVGMAADIDAKAIVVCSLSGVTARMVSRFRPPIDILALCVNEQVWKKLALSWGVTPVMSEIYPSIEVLFYAAKLMAAEAFHLRPGDKIIITGGTTGESGKTNTIRIETIG